MLSNYQHIFYNHFSSQIGVIITPKKILIVDIKRRLKSFIVNIKMLKYVGY